MSDVVRDGWIDGQPSVYVYAFRAQDTSEHFRYAAGDIVVRAHALHCGGTVWDRRIALGREPSYAQVREAIAKLTADALTALEGQP